MHITIVGTGYVGLVTGACFANSGNDVVCLDIDKAKIAKLKNGESPIYEPGLNDLLKRNIGAGRLHFTTDAREAYEHAEAIFICVGTPSDADGRAYLQSVFQAARDVGKAIESRAASAEHREPIVVVKSTVPVGTNQLVEQKIAEVTRKRFRMASNPEFLKEGDAIKDFMKPDRVVIGCADKETGDRLYDLYEPFVRQGNPILIMDIASAEMVKYAANAMLATKISFINEIAKLCEAYGANVDQVRKGMCADERIGNRFLFPGLGYGGSCFPKDVLSCVSMGKDVSERALLLEAVHAVNQHQRQHFLGKIEEYFGDSLSGKRIAVWGVAFKPGTDDVREAPSVTLMCELLKRGAEVSAFDPVANETGLAEMTERGVGDQVTFAPSAMAVLKDVDALVICTEWDEFRHPDFEQMKQLMRQPVIFDGRNIYRTEAMEEAGFTYISVGRKSVNVPAEEKIVTP